PGEGVNDDVGVGGDMETEHLDIVPGVRNDRYVAFWDDGGEALEKAGGADAAGEDGVHGGHCIRDPGCGVSGLAGGGVPGRHPEEWARRRATGPARAMGDRCDVRWGRGRRG